MVRRYSVDVVERIALARARAADAVLDVVDGTPRATAAFVARVCRIDPTTVEHARMSGGFTEATSDKVAAALGVHPANLWPEWDDVDDVTLEREAAAGERRHARRRRQAHRAAQLTMDVAS